MICLRSSNVGYQPLGRVSWQRPSPALLYGGTTARILPPPNPKNCRALLRQIFLAVQRGPSSHLLDLQPLVRSGLLTTKGNTLEPTVMFDSGMTYSGRTTPMATATRVKRRAGRRITRHNVSETMAERKSKT